MLETARGVQTRLIVTADAVLFASRCDERDADWMASRDPTGSMRDRLDEVGAYNDGCVDIGDEAEAIAAEMASRGSSVPVVRLTNPDAMTSSGPGGQVLEFGADDLALLTDTVMDVTGDPNP